MNISIDRETTVRELFQDIRDQYGSREQLEAHVEENPRDWDANVSLHNLDYYDDEDPDMEITETRTMVLPDESINDLTGPRIQLLATVQRSDGPIQGIRKLARILDRDVKNVSQDVHALRELGFLHVKPQGPGKAHHLSLPGEKITIELLAPDA